MENQKMAAPEKEKDEITDGKSRRSFKMDKRTTLIALVVLATFGVLFACKSLFVAATVDGMPISRLSVIEELEKASGRQALDILITKKLIETEALKANVTVSESDIDAEIETIEKQIAAQGSTLDAALLQQGLGQEQFREQILLQKKMEKILADKLAVTDEEVAKYMSMSKATIPAGVSEDEFKNQIRAQLKNQKFSTEAEKWVTALKAEATIKYYVKYGAEAPAPEVAPVTENQ